MAVGFPTKANWAAGDVLTASAQDDLAGTVNLLSNASAASGSQLVSNVAGTSFAYQATPSASNPILNAAMAVAQRGTTFTSATSSTYTLDRWQGFRGAGAAYNVSQQSTADTTNLPFIQYCARVGRPSGNTAVNTVYYSQSAETINSRPYAGKTVTYSFYARAGANYSAASNVLVCEVVTGTGTDQNVISGFTGGVSALLQSNTLTTTWQRFTVTGSIGSTATQLGFNFDYTPVGTAGTNDYFEITGVQIDIGSVALPFRTYAATYQGELAACQRYYYRMGGTAAYTMMGMGTGISTTVARCLIVNPVTMRTTPTLTEYSTLAIGDFVGSAIVVTSAAVDAASPSAATINFTTAGTTVVYRPYGVFTNASTSGYLGLSAEL